MGFTLTCDVCKEQQQLTIEKFKSQNKIDVDIVVGWESTAEVIITCNNPHCKNKIYDDNTYRRIS